MDELPWQLAKSWRWNEPHECLMDLDFFEALWKANEFDLKVYWATLEKHSVHQTTDSYFSTETIARTEGNRIRTFVHIGRLLYDTGRLNHARAGMDLLVRRCWQLGDLICLQESLGVLGVVLAGLREENEALAVLQEREQICRKLGDVRGVHESLGPQGCILLNKGDFDEARRIFEECEAFCRRQNGLNGLQASLGDQIGLYSQLGLNEKVWALQTEEERLCRQIGNSDGLARSLMNKSRLLLQAGQLDQAIAAGREAENIHRDIGDRLSLTRDLKNLGDICLKLEDPMSAIKYYSEGEQLCRTLGNMGGAFSFIADQGRAYAAQNLDSEAVALLRQAADAFVNLDMSDEKVEALESLVNIRQKQQDVRASIELNHELALEYRKRGDHRGLARNVFSEGALHLTEDAYQPETACKLLQEAMEISELHDFQDLKSAIFPILQQAEQRQIPSISCQTTRLSKVDLVGFTVADYQIRKLRCVESGTAVYEVFDGFRERECLLKIGKDNNVWLEGIDSLENLTNLEEQVPAIKESFRVRRAIAQNDKAAVLWFDGIPDILVASWNNIARSSETHGMLVASLRLNLVNEPRQRRDALRINEIDALAAKHDVPYSVNSIRRAYGEIFIRFIAAMSQSENSDLLNKETLLLLADKGFMLRIAKWVMDMDKRRALGRNADALQAVQKAISMVPSRFPLPLDDNILVLLHGLQTTGKIGPQEMLDTLYSKETYYNLSPHHVEQFEALTAWLHKASVPEEIVGHYEWLCQEARQLTTRTHQSQKERVEPSSVLLLDAPPHDCGSPGLCLEYCCQPNATQT